jgi:RND family efflux transporter MFP subunit
LTTAWARAGRLRSWLWTIAVLALLANLFAPGLANFGQKPTPPVAPKTPWASLPVANDASERGDSTQLASLGAKGEQAPGWEPPEEPELPEPLAEDATSFDCIIEPSEVVAIGSPVAGRIETIQVERSNTVETDQVLVQLESGVETAAVALSRARAKMEANVKAQEASLDLEKRRTKRVKHLFESKTVSLDVQDQAETEAEIARLQLVDATEQRRLASLQLQQAIQVLKRRTIRSPIDGVVVQRLMSPGEVVDDDETILTLARIDPLRIEVLLPAALYGTVQPGMRAAVEPEFPAGQVHVASVEIVDRVIDGASGTFGVRLELPNPEHAIPGGLNCRVRFLDE